MILNLVSQILRWQHWPAIGCRHISVDSSALTNPAAPGSSPKHTIYDFIIYSICAICHVKRTKINTKRPGLAHLNKTSHTDPMSRLSLPRCLCASFTFMILRSLGRLSTAGIIQLSKFLAKFRMAWVKLLGMANNTCKEIQQQELEHKFSGATRLSFLYIE